MFRPQLARSFKEGKDDWMWEDPGIVADEKLDGHRIVIMGDRQFSRNGKEKGVRFLERGFPIGCKLDGEIIVRRGLGLPGGHSEVSHWLAHDESKLEVVIFDLIAWNSSSDFSRFSLTNRLDALSEFETEYSALFGDGVGTATRVYNYKKPFYTRIVDNGGEGIILKKLDAPYAQHSRASWIKVKAWDAVDLVITDCNAKPSEWRVRPGAVDSQTGQILPEGDHTESFKLGYVNLSYGFYDQYGKLRVVGSTGVTGPRAEMEQYVGKTASFKSFGRQYDSGALQHPVLIAWRDDKDPEECVFEFKEAA